MSLTVLSVLPASDALFSTVYRFLKQSKSGHVYVTLQPIHSDQFKHNLSSSGAKCESPPGCVQEFTGH